MKINNKYNLSILVGSLLFAIIYSLTVWTVWWPQWQAGSGQQLIFNWPDANANYFSAKVLAEEHTFKVFEPLNLSTDNLLHTRSLNVIDGFLLPMTWLPNIAIFALFFALLGAFGVLLLTPLLSAAIVFLVYKILELVFQDKRLAFFASLLFWPLAPWFYFSQLAMLTNILFIFLVVLAAFLFAKKSYWSASLFLSLSLMCRPTELVWLLLSFVCLFYWQRRQFSRQQLISSVLVFAAVVLAGLYLNKIVYGSYFSFGYINFQDKTLPTEILDRQTNVFAWLKAIFIPFGFNLKLIVYNFAKYFVKLVWPYIILALFGLFYWFKNRRSEKLWSGYLVLNIIIFVFILLFYGSWDLADPLVKNLNFISSSYVRYFLPLYILLLPWAAHALSVWSKHARWPKVLVWPLLIILAAFSLYSAYGAKYDGLFKHQQYLAGYWQEFSLVKNLAPQGSVIVTERADKIFFPYYKVVVPQGDLPLWPRLAKIVEQVPIYYYSDKDQNALAAEQAAAAQSGLQLSDKIEIANGFFLYKIHN
ncbi:MAG: hypothetical protein WC465_01000 [Patescibacteria group bacterium]